MKFSISSERVLAGIILWSVLFKVPVEHQTLTVCDTPCAGSDLVCATLLLSLLGLLTVETCRLSLCTLE